MADHIHRVGRRTGKQCGPVIWVAQVDVGSVRAQRQFQLHTGLARSRIAALADGIALKLGSGIARGTQVVAQLALNIRRHHWLVQVIGQFNRKALLHLFHG